MNKYLFLLFLFLYSPSTAQIYIDFPNNNWVVQRDASNHGKIQIQGRVAKNIENLECRFTNNLTEKTVTYEWKKITTFQFEDVDLKYFNFVEYLTAGSYTFEIKGIQHNEIVTYKINKIGIGEVFIIAGQSNAQGQSNREVISPSSNQLFCAFKNTYDEFSQPEITFEQLSNYSQIFPTGQSSWCWGVLGDSLYKRLHVPILFFNTAIGSTSSEDWALSVDEKSNVIPMDVVLQNIDLKHKVPYIYLKQIIKYYKNLTGFRAILWHQGENDTLHENDIRNTSYFDNINKVIRASRNEINEEIPWVISRVSYAFGKVNGSVINDQNRLIKTVSQVFAGPYTDTLTNARGDNLHFSNEYNSKGINRLGQVWNLALTDSFFIKANPILPEFNKVDVLCRNFKQILGIKNLKNIGSYIIAFDYATSIYHPFFFNKIEDFVNPKISFLGDSVLCKNHFPKLYFNGSTDIFSFKWNNNIENATLNVEEEGIYFVTYKSKYCDLEETSNTFTISNFSKLKPTFSYSGKLESCENDSLSLISNSANEVVWNDGSKLKNRKITSPGYYFLSEIKQNGCKSLNSDSVVVVRHAKPKPIVQIIESNNTLIAIDSNKISPKYQWTWNLNSLQFSSKTIPFDESGTYVVKSYFDYKSLMCSSDAISQYFYKSPLSLSPNEADFQVYPNPISATKTLHIAYSKPFNIELYTLSGVLILSQNFTSTDASINLKNLPSGTYLIRLRSQEKTKTSKICIE